MWWLVKAGELVNACEVVNDGFEDSYKKGALPEVYRVMCSMYYTHADRAASWHGRPVLLAAMSAACFLANWIQGGSSCWRR